jgi:hypothetical protein
MERMARAEAGEYANWAAAGKSLDTWIAVPEDLRMFGISATLVDAPSGGKIFRAEQAGIAYLSFGPTIVFKGGLRILDLLKAGELVGAIDLRSQSILARGTETFELVPNVLKLVASVELSAALQNQNHTYVALAGHANFLDTFHAIASARVVPLQGAAARLAGQVSAETQICGFGGGYNFSADVAAELGWNPIGLGGHIGISGSAWILALGRKLGLGVGLVTDIQVNEPKIFTFDLVFTLNLPWPLDDLHFPVKIFAYENMIPADPLPPLKFGPLDPLSWYHGPSGKLGKLTADDTKLWPDAILSLDFQRQAGKSAIIVNPSSGARDEANVKVEHEFKGLKIEKLDPNTGRHDLVDSVRASWLLSANGERSETTSRLAIPCNDPLGWLNRFDYAQPSTIEPIDRPKFQTFGAGPSHFFDVGGRGTASASFEEVDIESPAPFWLVPVPWANGYDRVLLVRSMQIGFSMKLPSGNLPLATSACDLRFLGLISEPPRIAIRNGTANPPSLIRRIDAWHAEWSILILRAPLESGLALFINSEEPLQLAAIGYTVNREILNPVPDHTVLRPGFYRLTIEGESRATFKGHPSNRSPIKWDGVREFEIIPPDQIRPYVRYSTVGDERIFGLEYGGWNPNPRGSGFGHYHDHFGQIRARVGYLSKIYPRLWIAPRDTDPAVRVSVGQCLERTPCGAKASQDWKVATGLPVPIEEELNFNVPADVGTHRLLAYRSLRDDGTDLEVVDEWTYRVSRYANPVQHLTPGLTGLNRIFGPFGSRSVSYVRPPPLPNGLDFDAVPEAKLRLGWALPRFLENFANLQNPQAGLCFLRALDWCGIFAADRDPFGEGIMFRPDDTDLCAVFDEGRAPVALVLRTCEPCDWRRIDFTLVVGTFDANGARLATKLIPSTDGCACLVLAMAEGVPVRLPRTSIAMRVRFKLRAEGLPRLTVVNDTAREVEEIRTTFDQPFGSAW